ncbi:Gluconate transport-inducing protein [Blastocladiella emersonii ATCC 22665]|nr:Gluconate transport-inducing protein [Blastocladiella emersonii ATCC 22665]
METWYGLVRSLDDALRIVEAARSGILPRVTRRLTDEERSSLVRSGATFVFEESESQVRRWADSRLWSSSRMKGHFLEYKELEGSPADLAFAASNPNAPPTDADAANRASTSPGPAADEVSATGSSSAATTPGRRRASQSAAPSTSGAPPRRTLLKKRALSLATLYGQKLRLISYFSEDDAARLPTIDADERIATLDVPAIYFAGNDVPVALSRKSATRHPLLVPGGMVLAPQMHHPHAHAHAIAPPPMPSQDAMMGVHPAQMPPASAGYLPHHHHHAVSAPAPPPPHSLAYRRGSSVERRASPYSRGPTAPGYAPHHHAHPHAHQPPPMHHQYPPYHVPTAAEDGYAPVPPPPPRALALAPVPVPVSMPPTINGGIPPRHPYEPGYSATQISTYPFRNPASASASGMAMAVDRQPSPTSAMMMHHHQHHQYFQQQQQQPSLATLDEYPSSGNVAAAGFAAFVNAPIGAAVFPPQPQLAPAAVAEHASGPPSSGASPGGTMVTGAGPVSSSSTADLVGKPNTLFADFKLPALRPDVTGPGSAASASTSAAAASLVQLPEVDHEARERSRAAPHLRYERLHLEDGRQLRALDMTFRLDR